MAWSYNMAASIPRTFAKVKSPWSINLPLLTVLFIKALTGTGQSVLFQNVRHNDVIFTGNILFESSAWTKGHCSLLCGNDARCVAFTFTGQHNQQSVCRGYSPELYVSVSTARQNTEFYHVTVHKVNQSGICHALQLLQPGSGVRQMRVGEDTPLISAYCDQDTDGGRWTVIQRRQDGSVNFNRTWADFQAGFGGPAGEYWLGLETVYRMTTGLRYEIRFDLQLFDGTSGYAVFSNFSVGPGSEFYKLYLGNITAGNLPFFFTYDTGNRFSAWDRDVDTSSADNCAAMDGGGWWYGACGYIMLNAPYRPTSSCPPSDCYSCPMWHGFGEYCENSLRATDIKIRPM